MTSHRKLAANHYHRAPKHASLMHWRTSLGTLLPAVIFWCFFRMFGQDSQTDPMDRRLASQLLSLQAT
jgi:hypothetical protein